MKLLPDNKLIAWGTVAGALLTACSMFGTVISYSVRIADDVGFSRSHLADHETRLRTIEADARETRVNVAWIRGYLDPQPVLPAERQATLTHP
jgi:hypothetical protein